MSSASTYSADRLACLRAELDRDGCTMLSGVFAASEAAEMLAAVESALEAGDDPAIRGDEGAVYAARNILVLWPAVATVWRRPPVLRKHHPP